MKNLTWQNPDQVFVAQELINKVKSKCCGIKDYDKLGLASSNTYITLNSDGTFSSKINGKSFSGKWTFDEDASLLTLKGTLLTINGYAKRNTNGISILFEATKLLSLMQTMAAISGNSTLQGIGELSKNYDGLRIGFDMKK